MELGQKGGHGTTFPLPLCLGIKARFAEDPQRIPHSPPPPCPATLATLCSISFPPPHSLFPEGRAPIYPHAFSPPLVKSAPFNTQAFGGHCTFWGFQLECVHLLSTFFSLCLLVRHVRRILTVEDFKPVRDNSMPSWILEKALKKLLQHEKLWPPEQNLNLVHLPENIFESIFFLCFVSFDISLCMSLYGYYRWGIFCHQTVLPTYICKFTFHCKRALFHWLNTNECSFYHLKK